MDRKKIIFLIVALVVVAAAIYFFLFRQQATEEEARQAQLQNGAGGFPQAPPLVKLNIPSGTPPIADTNTSAPPPWWAELEGRGVRNTANGRIYLIQGGKKLWLSTPYAYARTGWPARYEDAVRQGQIRQLSAIEINQIPEGQQIT